MFSLENYHRFSHTHRRASRLKSRNLFNIRFFLWVFGGFFWRESTSLAIYCTNLRSQVKCQTNESKPPDEDYILITSGD